MLHFNESVTFEESVWRNAHRALQLCCYISVCRFTELASSWLWRTWSDSRWLQWLDSL